MKAKEAIQIAINAIREKGIEMDSDNPEREKMMLAELALRDMKENMK